MMRHDQWHPVVGHLQHRVIWWLGDKPFLSGTAGEALLSEVYGTRREKNNLTKSACGKWLDRIGCAVRQCAPVVSMSSTNAIGMGAGLVRPR